MAMLILSFFCLVFLYFYKKESDIVNYGERSLGDLRSKFMMNVNDVGACREIRDEASQLGFYIHENIGVFRSVTAKKVRNEIEGFVLDLSAHIVMLERNSNK